MKRVITIYLFLSCLALSVSSDISKTRNTEANRRVFPGVERAILNDLVSFWKLSDLTDSVGTNTLTNNAVATFVAGKIGNAASFIAGSNLSVATNSTLEYTGTSLTLCGWFNFNAFGAFQTIAAKDHASGVNREYGMYIENPATNPPIHFFAFDPAYSGTAPGSHLVDVGRSVPLVTGTWYFACGWYDKLTDYTYIEVNASPNLGTSTNVGPSGFGGVKVGAAAFSLGSDDNTAQFMNGLVDAWGLWKRTLTLDERLALYNAGTGMEHSFPTVSTELFWKPVWNRSPIPDFMIPSHRRNLS